MDIRGYFAAGGSIKSEENKKNTPADKDNDKAQFRRRTFHEPNLIQIKAGPNHENPAFWFRRRT